MKKKILLIEDDPTLSRNIKDALSEEQIDVETVFDGLLAEKLLNKYNFDCIILDINLPGKNGYEVCRAFRSYNKHTPIIMLTAFGELEDKVQGFDCGADDYLTKPFYMRELLLRVQVLMKRNNQKTSPDSQFDILQSGDLVINKTLKRVSCQDQEINLTPREFQILVMLVEQKGEYVSKTSLIQEVWGTRMDVNTNTIEVFINFLRNKVDKPFNKKTILTKPGFGYYFQP